jgi:hypothetical protein
MASSATSYSVYPILKFAVWKRQLREDCARTGKLLAFDGFGDFVLKMFWERGLEPTVQAIIEDGDDDDSGPSSES